MKPSNKLTALTIQTNIPHDPKQAYTFRSSIIEHAIITFLIQLRLHYPKLFKDVKAIEVLNRIFKKNNGYLSPEKEEQLDHIVTLLHDSYPGLQYFHNHMADGSSSQINYPLIHYRCHKGKAVIQAFNEAIPIVEQWLSAADWKSWISYKQVADKKLEHQVIRVTEKPRYYRLMDWLALNDEAYKKWNQMRTLKERAILLDEMITGHSRRLAQSFLIDQEWPEIIGELCNIRKIKKVKGYHHSDLALNVIFRVNMEIPTALSMGRSVSLGFGTQSSTAWQENASKDKESEELATTYV